MGQLGTPKTEIPIFNDTDNTEIVIKQNIFIGQRFSKGWNEVYRTIGLDNLGIKSLAGGKQKRKAQETVLQYSDFKNETIGKRSLICVDIYEIPHYLEKTENRGKGGFYMDRIIPIMVQHFLTLGESSLNTNITELAKVAGLANSKYKNISLEELKELDTKFTDGMVNQFYSRSKPQQQAVIFRILDRLQNDYSVLTYYKNFCITTTSGVYTSSTEEDTMIRMTQRAVLKEFGVSRIMQIYFQKKEKEFYKRVCDKINEAHHLDWIEYRSQIQIYVDLEGINELSQTLVFSRDELSAMKAEVLSHFASIIKHRTFQDFNRTNTHASLEGVYRS